MTPTLLAIACPLAVTLCYTALCAASPYGDCRKCRGFGYQLKTNRRGRLKRGKDCRRCKTTGKRIRIGRWIYNRAVRIYRDGTRQAHPSPRESRHGTPR